MAALAGHRVLAFEPMEGNLGALRRTLCATPALQQRYTLVPKVRGWWRRCRLPWCPEMERSPARAAGADRSLLQQLALALAPLSPDAKTLRCTWGSAAPAPPNVTHQPTAGLPAGPNTSLRQAATSVPCLSSRASATPSSAAPSWHHPATTATASQLAAVRRASHRKQLGSSTL